MIRRMRMALLVLCLLGLGAGAVLTGAGFLYLATPLAVDEGGYVYTLEPGSGVSRMARDLAADGVVRFPRWLTLVAVASGRARGVQAGEYALWPGQTVGDLLALVRSGDVVQYSVTFPEGWTFREMRQALESREKLKIVTAGLPDAVIMERLGAPGEHPEGRFFPDTYAYTAGMRDLDVLGAAHRRMSRILAEEWEARDPGLPYETPYEGLIMASIIEKETGVPGERGAIAGVFVRRLQKGMRLQTDPTVVYGLGDRYQGNLQRRHLREATPYNTYMIHGLPPTPIAMPGRAAIHAAFHPEEGEALYFVARGDGSHHFSATLAEHNRAVKKYQVEKRARDYRSSPAPQ